jgi:hypothetical protein
MPGVAATLAVALVLLGVLATGCSEENPLALPRYDPAAAPAAPTPTLTRATLAPVPREPTPPPQVHYRPADARGMGAWVERGRITVGSGSERAVVEAVQKYLTVRVQLSNTWKVDERALAATATGRAVTSARERAALQRERERRSIGRFVLNVSTVRLDGDDRATVTGCDFDATSEVDEAGNILVPPPGGILVTLSVRRSGGVWRVSDWPEGSVPYCDWRR